MENHPKTKRLQVHVRHLARLEKHLARMEGENQRLSWTRLGAFVGGVVATFLAFQVSELVGWFVGLLAVVGFGMLVGRHRKLDRARRDFGIARLMAARQIARMELDWAGIPRVEAHPDDASPLARDLMLTGERSLLQLLNTAFSRGGTDRLRGWLLRPDTAPRVIRERQALLQEMLPLTGFRTRLGRVSARVRTSERPWEGERLVQWLERHQGPGSLRPALFFLFPFALLNVTLFVLWLAGGLPYWMVGAAVYFVVYLGWQSTLRDLFGDAAYLRDALNEFAAVSQFLERYPHPAGVARVCAPFLNLHERRSFGETNGIQRDRKRNAVRRNTVRDERPSKLLRGVAGVASAASLQRNPFVWMPLNLIMPWDLFFAYRLEGMKARLRALLPGWLEAWYELEALNSLANFAYLNPETTFPGVAADGPVLVAEGVGHPLIPDGVRATNDFSLAALGEVAVITGSNMSGKSTFLRTLGVNLVLAYAGGPMLARRLRVRPMRVGTSIQVSDSLADGLSYFYAEVKRLKGLLDNLQETDALPLFFLIDELFRGTNNEERRKGSEAYVRALAGAHGVGLVSTHDLELTHLAETIPGVSNFHFREEITDGRMVFDYRLRPGPCPTTNALKIMALEGLPVGEREV
ncbi:MAG: hypothetical protein H6636_07710 [Anaerolineales bacterium]|nr:hypothetical protein [Anaerolineales bacterium]